MLEIFNVGVDIIEVDRIRKAAENTPGFLERVFTDKEIDYCLKKNKVKYQNFAARFAAKEAVAKSLMQGMGKYVSFREIEIHNRKNGAPYVQLHSSTLQYSRKIRIKEIKISLSATEKMATAFAVSILSNPNAKD